MIIKPLPDQKDFINSLPFQHVIIDDFQELVKNFPEQLIFLYSFKYNEYNDYYIKLNYEIFLGSGITTLLYPAST